MGYDVWTTRGESSTSCGHQATGWEVASPRRPAWRGDAMSGARQPEPCLSAARVHYQ